MGWWRCPLFCGNSCNKSTVFPLLQELWPFVWTSKWVMSAITRFLPCGSLHFLPNLGTACLQARNIPKEDGACQHVVTLPRGVNEGCGLRGRLERWCVGLEYFITFDPLLSIWPDFCFMLPRNSNRASSPRTRPLMIDEDIIDPPSTLEAFGQIYRKQFASGYVCIYVYIVYIFLIT